jgi:hypothetical protein
MAKGAYLATAASTLLVAADEYREYLTIQHGNATAVALGIGVPAVALSGIQLFKAGDSVKICGAQARLAVYVIGNGGVGSYQDGNVSYSGV